jgi:hypothetical protein
LAHLSFALSHSGGVLDDEGGVDSDHVPRSRGRDDPPSDIINAAFPIGVENAPLRIDDDKTGLMSWFGG